jgi:hypothetical protein
MSGAFLLARQLNERASTDDATGQKPAPDNVRCALLARANANREPASTGQSLTGQSHCPVLCPVPSAPLSPT